MLPSEMSGVDSYEILLSISKKYILFLYGASISLSVKIRTRLNTYNIQLDDGSVFIVDYYK